jgi:hypothetical protein
MKTFLSLLDDLAKLIGLLCLMASGFAFSMLVYARGHHVEAWFIGGFMFYAVMRCAYYVDVLQNKLRAVPEPKPVAVDIDGVLSDFEARFKDTK